LITLEAGFRFSKAQSILSRGLHPHTQEAKEPCRNRGNHLATLQAPAAPVAPSLWQCSVNWALLTLLLSFIIFSPVYFGENHQHNCSSNLTHC